MKKLFAILLAVTMLASMATVASAAENTTTLTTTVPAATYTLNIPADQKIPFGSTSKSIGNVTITDASGFAEGKNLKVKVVYGAFECEDVTTTIPFRLEAYWASAANLEVASGSSLTFYGDDTGALTESAQVHYNDKYHNVESIILKTDSADWGKALAGEYTATITYTAEVVVE